MTTARKCLPLIGLFLAAACATEPYSPGPPAPIRQGTSTAYPQKAPAPPTRLTLPNGVSVSIMSGTTPLPDCSIFGITDPNAICISVPASLADGRGGGAAQQGYAERLNSAGYEGSATFRSLNDGSACRQRVTLSTLPAAATQSDDWKDVQEYVLFMEFTPLVCP